MDAHLKDLVKIGFVTVLFLLFFMNINIGSININGCRNARKRATLLDYIHLKKTSVVFLRETHSDIDNQPQWECDWKGPGFISHGSNVSAGVAILFSPAFPWKDFSMVEIISGRLLRVDVMLGEQHYSFINVFAPNDGQERGVFFNALKDAIKNCRP